MKSANSGSCNTPLDKVHHLSEMAIAVKHVIKRDVFHDDKCTGITIDNMEGSDDTLKVFIHSTDVDIDLLKSKLEVCHFNCSDIKTEGAGTSCIVSRMNERKTLLRQIRAIIRGRLGEPENKELVAITAFSKSRKRIEITIRRSVIDEENFLKFLDDLLALTPIKIERRNGEIVFQCKIQDYEDFELTPYRAYWLSTIAPFNDVQSFVLSRWDDPDWRVEMAPSDDKKNYVFVLVSSIRHSDAETWEALRIAERKLNKTINARYGSFSLQAHIRNSEVSHHTISACYYVSRGRFTDSWAPECHIRDCELDSSLDSTNSNKRHNRNCENYRKTRGYPCSKSEGTPCKICGG